ncbi:MAG TPA: NAD-dependent epimerase/dehydratase family protein [Thermoanaerobaculia bacterium]|nr:NAD-dependent epimerase/dehydratase family protein [Thermoanaerobaculia bacterium]
MKILVTGAAGFIASNLIPRLLERGDEVAGADNFFLGKRAYVVQHPRFTFHELDLLDLEGVAKLIAEFRPDRIWHLAANSDISYGTKYTDFDLKGGTLVTYNVLEAMRRAGIGELVFSSSGAVYGEPTVMPTPENYGPILPISLYAASKVACESLITAYAHNYDIRAWVYRFGNIVGPNPTHGVIHDFVLRLREEPTKLVVLGDGTQAKPYVYVEDCLDGMEFGVANAREHVNVYNLAVDDQTTVRQITDWTIEAMGIDRTRIDVQYGDSPRGWRGDVPQVKLDTRRMQSLGWTPKLSSNEAVRKSIEVTVAQFRNGPLQ